jgi:zinc transport system ATP-binding protein
MPKISERGLADMRLLECSNLNMSYENVQAVKNLSFHVDQGDYLCIVGNNGSGKTTLIKGLLGLMALDTGRISYIGIKKNEIGYLPQKTAVQKDFPASVMEVVLSGCLNRSKFKLFYTKHDRKIALENMDRLGISDLAYKSYIDLSGGQQQRVLLARALCSAQRLILLDEPMTSLDPVAANSLYNLIATLNREYNITVIMVSHDVSTAIKYANKVLHMETEPLFFGASQEYVRTDIGKKMLGADKNA